MVKPFPVETLVPRRVCFTRLYLASKSACGWAALTADSERETLHPSTLNHTSEGPKARSKFYGAVPRPRRFAKS